MGAYGNEVWIDGRNDKTPLKIDSNTKERVCGGKYECYLTVVLVTSKKDK